MDIRKIGVIGAGQMGNGIAHVAALAGIDVALHDLSEDRIKSGLATINGNMSRQLSKNLITEEERQGALLRIEGAPKVDDLADCDLSSRQPPRTSRSRSRSSSRSAPCCGRMRSWRRTPRRSRSRVSPRRQTVPSASSASIS